jgi:hypothetical protein
MKTKITKKEKSFFNTLVDILHKDYKISPEKGFLYLTEDKEPTYPKTKLLVENKISLYKFDKDIRGKPLFPFFSDGEQKACCDYIGFYIIDNQCFILLINLKTKSKSNNKSQLEGGALLANFIVETAQRLLGKSQYLEIKSKAFLFTTRKVIKDDFYFFRDKKEKFYYQMAGVDLDVDLYCE